MRSSTWDARPAAGFAVGHRGVLEARLGRGCFGVDIPGATHFKIVSYAGTMGAVRLGSTPFIFFPERVSAVCAIG